MKALLFLLLPLLLSPLSHATSTPSGGGFIPWFIQAPDYEGEIKGVRINPGWGYHKTVYGIDVGMVGNTTSNEFVGMSVAGIFITNLGRTVVTGIQMSGLFNRNSGKTHIGGIQFTAGINSAGDGETSVYGLQFGLLGNIGKNKVYGFQIGLYNQAEAVYGFQIGLINKTKSLNGIQIGLANFSEDGGLPFFPVINVGF